MPCLPAALDWHLPCNNSWSAGQAAHLRICSATHLFIRSAAHPSPPPPPSPRLQTPTIRSTRCSAAPPRCCWRMATPGSWSGAGAGTVQTQTSPSAAAAPTHTSCCWGTLTSGAAVCGVGRGGGWVAGLLGFSVSAFATACAVGISPHPLSSPPTPPHPPTCPQAVPAGPCGACWPRAVLPRLPVGYRAPHG